MTEANHLEVLWARAATPLGVSPRIHPDDLLWPFILGHPAFPDPVDAANYYFSDGAESARKLAELIERHVGPGRTGGARLLEFASGYGMVTRHLPRALPGVDVLSCDIHPAAVDFVRDQLGGKTMLSEHRPEDFDPHETFDVVFALSFFSHMPAATFGPWLAALYRAVRPGGVLAFTTHGLSSRAALGDPPVNADGFWFMPSSEQSDLDGGEYGSSLSTPDFVVRELYRHVGAPLAEYRGGYWWEHQDLYVVAKPIPATG
ncbi:MAG: hypothetical protein QOE97_3904 [Pseudonocardiales bacterium]|nr:hypothetical protein [Pseudonocardiales bacterium]